MCALLCLVSFTEDNFLRFIYIITCISTSFLFVAKQYSTVYICVCVCVLYIHLASKVALMVKNLMANANAGDVRDTGSIPGFERSSGEGNGNPLQYSCLENPMDRGTWWTTVHRVKKSWIRLKQLSRQGCIHSSTDRYLSFTERYFQFVAIINSAAMKCFHLIFV